MLLIVVALLISFFRWYELRWMHDVLAQFTILLFDYIPG